MKNLKQTLIAGGVIGSGLAAFAATGNPFAAIAAASTINFAAQKAAGVSLFDANGVASCTGLIGIKRQCQTLTIGGAKRLYIGLAEDLLTEFLTYELAKTLGKFSGAIPMVAGKKFIEVEAWYDSTKFDTEMKIGAGFTQSMEFKLLGYNDIIVKFAALMYETPVVVIVQGNDDKLYMLGQKYIPLMFEMKGVLPEKGTARKEATFSAKQDGMMVPVFPLDATVTFETEPLVGVEAPEGGA
ncbi:hypothetical protein [Dyadobacter sp. CY343]|uniref:hypothetical protein n=1 Tax=Dyadobacter sp. CY343 TaxID=2907299 RepID=UPI001F1EDAD5|nr:hypothetical protein [Dyadobacter sp. CY343]MCE7061263.1 hypothetical protein [Dyadobacter sp. CY343]